MEAGKEVGGGRRKVSEEDVAHVNRFPLMRFPLVRYISQISSNFGLSAPGRLPPDPLFKF